MASQATTDIGPFLTNCLAESKALGEKYGHNLTLRTIEGESKDGGLVSSEEEVVKLR